MPLKMPVLAAQHLFCEKPLATNAAHATAMADAAAAAGVVNVNLSYRNVPALQKAAQMVAGGAMGRSGIFRRLICKLADPAPGRWRHRM